MQIKQYLSPHLIAVLGISLLCTYLMQNYFILNCDVDWLLASARRLLDGGIYSKDFFETNPPLILFLYTPPVIVSQLFSISIPVTAKVYFVALSLLSFAWCYPLIMKLFHKNNLLGYWFSFWLLFVFLCLPCNEFGQREHLIVVFCMPYILSVAYQLEGYSLTRSQTIVLGIFSALGFSLKPFYLLLPLAIEIYFALQRKKLTNFLRLENYIVAAFALTYALITAIFFKDYLYQLVPFASRYYYQGYLPNLLTICNLPYVMFFAIVMYMLLINRKRSPSPYLISVLSIAFVCLYLGYLMQISGWFYKIIPLFAVSMLMLALLFSQNLEETYQQKFNFYEAAFLSVILVIFMRKMPGDYPGMLPYLQEYFFVIYGILVFSFYYYILNREKAAAAFIKSIYRVMVVVGGGFTYYYFTRKTLWDIYSFYLTIIFINLLFALNLPKKLKSKNAFAALFLYSNILVVYPLLYWVSLYAGNINLPDVRLELITYLKKDNDNRGKSLYFFAGSNYAHPTIEYTGMRSASRLPFFWMIPGILIEEKKEHPNPHFQADKAFFINMVTDDFERHKPDLVFINTNDAYLGERLDYANYFFRNEKMQSIIKKYMYIGHFTKLNYYDFEIYKRVEA